MDADCVLRFTMPRNTQLTLSTLPPPSPRVDVQPSPPETRFPLPWSADFSGPSGEQSAMPSYFADLNGAFSLAMPFDGGTEPVMQQNARYVPIMWWGDSYPQAKLPLTIFGDAETWINVTVTAVAALVSPPIIDPFGWNSSCGTTCPDQCPKPISGASACTGYGVPLNCSWANTSVTVAVRVGAAAPSWAKIQGTGLFFTVSVTGEWQLTAAGTKVRVLASGRLATAFGVKTWHKISLTVEGCRLVASVDGVVVADANDAGCSLQPGWGAVGSGWHSAQFKEVRAE